MTFLARTEGHPGIWTSEKVHPGSSKYDVLPELFLAFQAGKTVEARAVDWKLRAELLEEIFPPEVRNCPARKALQGALEPLGFEIDASHGAVWDSPPVCQTCEVWFVNAFSVWWKHP